MSNKLFVGGLSWGTTDDMLRDAFAPYGNIREAKVILDRETGRSRGFGFVTFETVQSATDAQEKMNDAVLDGRNLRVNEAFERSRIPQNQPGVMAAPRWAH
jgi:RNA recognition motif-containing protein